MGCCGRAGTDAGPLRVLSLSALQGLTPGERWWLPSNDGAGGTLAAMHSYNEALARRIVADVARATSERPQGWVMLHEVAWHLKVDEASAEAAMRIAVAWGWLDAEGSCRTYPMRTGRPHLRKSGTLPGFGCCRGCGAALP